MFYDRHDTDPFWTKAKDGFTCDCGKPVAKGEDIFYFPKYGTAECRHCGRKSADQLADDIHNQILRAM